MFVNKHPAKVSEPHHVCKRLAHVSKHLACVSQLCGHQSRYRKKQRTPPIPANIPRQLGICSAIVGKMLGFYGFRTANCYRFPRIDDTCVGHSTTTWALVQTSTDELTCAKYYAILHPTTSSCILATTPDLHLPRVHSPVPIPLLGLLSDGLLTSAVGCARNGLRFIFMKLAL